MTDVTTALAFVIPDRVDEINTIRATQDRAYPRWMPHINFIFPFVPIESFDHIKSKLDQAFNGKFDDMEITFEGVDCFKQARGATFHLKPNKASEADLVKVFNLIIATLPEIQIKHDKFNPHCTISQCEKKDINAKQKELTTWFNSTFGGKLTVPLNKICMIKRSVESSDMMTIKKEIHLTKN